MIGRKKMIKYCLNCVAPSTKPNLEFDDDGVCLACRNHEKKKEIDWGSRKERLKDFIFWQIEYLSDIKPLYDIIVPVSGGKDSIAQVHYAVHELKLKTLAVNVDYGKKTKIGTYNLNLIPDIGADLITFRPEQILHKDLVKHAFLQTGTPDSINHLLLYCYPIHLADMLNIPLVMFGENPEFEYTGSKDFKLYQDIDQRWYDKNISYSDEFLDYLREQDYEKIKYYFLPENRTARTIFLGDYIFWDSEVNLKIAEQYGFRKILRRKGTYRQYSGIDEEWNILHQFTKFRKFGYARATDHACEDIRTGRITRDKAKELVKLYDAEELSNELVYYFCEYIGITEKHFWKVINKNTNWIILGEVKEIQKEW